MYILHKMSKWIFSWQDVDLSSQCIPKRVLPSADHVVKNTACWEHVHRCCLKREQTNTETFRYRFNTDVYGLCYMCVHPTGLLPGVSRSTSGAIHPSVPGIPDRREKLHRPSGIFLQSPKSEMRARTLPSALGPERRMFLGFKSRWTRGKDDGGRSRNCDFREAGG